LKGFGFSLALRMVDRSKSWKAGTESGNRAEKGDISSEKLEKHVHFAEFCKMRLSASAQNISDISEDQLRRPFL